MDKIIPVFYSEYGRYISRFRMIPLNIDGLIPVNRRLLLTMHRIARKTTKSARIVGELIGTLHAHGDSAAYESLVNLVRNGFADSTKSTWGGPGLVDAPAPASRYTETSILPWVDKMGFEYVDYVPWESLELDKEPLYLPSIVPIGLIGGGIHVGLAYHKTVIPKYKKQDLVKRLLWLLRVGKKYKVPDDFSQDLSESEYGPFIAPYKDDCNVVEEEKNAFVKILMSGEGRVSYNPKVMLNESGKNIKLEILGRAPLATFQSLLNDYSKNLLPFTDKPIDQSKKSIHIVASLKRNINVDDFIEDFREKYLNKSVNFKCYFCNLDGVVKQYSIDNILINCFNKWRTASINKLINDVQIVNSKIINNRICTEIRNIIHTHPTVKSIDELIGLFNFSITQTINQYNLDSNSWVASEIRLTDNDVRNVCTTVNIQKLIEYKSIEEKLFEEFNKIKHNIDNYDNYIIHVLKENLK